MLYYLKLIIYFAVQLFISQIILGQKDQVILMKPSGPFNIGTVSYEWEDANQEISLDFKRSTRTIVVKIWYPSAIEKGSMVAPYAPQNEGYGHVKGNTFYQPAFFNVGDKTNLILISPGRGTAAHLYTSLAEEWASHGYVVAAVDMPEIGNVTYSNGLHVPPSDRFQPPGGMMAGPYERVDKFFETLNWHLDKYHF